MKKRMWIGASAVCIGPLHVRENLPMQDSNRIKFLPNGFIAAVSDGLGSKVHSDFGSDAACGCFVKCAKKWIKRKLKSPEKFLKYFHSQWIKRIEKTVYKVSDCAATFLGAVCLKDRLVLFRLGDGMITCLSNDGLNNIMLSDKKNESFSNMTSCLRSSIDKSEWEIQTIKAKNISCLFLCTDGISDDLKKGVEFEFLKDLYSQYMTFNEKEIKSDMKKWINHWSVPRHSDDKTAVYIQRK